MLVETLVQDDERRVVGVVARIDGESAACVPAAAWCCAPAQQPRHGARHAPWLWRCKMRRVGDDGRGIRMGLGAGGEAIRMEHPAASCCPSRFPRSTSRASVNAQGQRFVNEDAYQTDVAEAALRAHDGRSTWSSTTKSTSGRFPRGIAAVGESIEELERELGLAEGSLQHTVASYNRYAAMGEDPLFHKTAEFLKPLTKPPFGALDYRVEKSLWSVFTMGGLRTSVNGEVLTADGDAIAGLYAAGRTTSGLAAQGYSSGLSLADATFFGRRAGIRAVEAVPA